MQLSCELNVTLGWQKTPEDVRLVPDDSLERCSTKFVRLVTENPNRNFSAVEFGLS